MGLRWWRDVLIRSQTSDTLTTARPINTGSYRLVRLDDTDLKGLKIRVRSRGTA